MILHKARILPVLFLAIVMPSATSFSFNFSSFDPGSQSKIKLEGMADFADSSIMLTSYSESLADSSRATYNDPLLLWNHKTNELISFTTQFSFIINSNATNHADGFAFFLAPYPAKLPLYSQGGYLGLYSNTTIEVNSTSSAVAVEFDTFSNYEWDPEGEHLGIDINSINSSKSVNWSSSIKEHRVGNARVDYDSITHSLSLFLTYPETNQSPSANYSISYTVNLREVLPEHVAVGFSAATGNYTEMHSIISWSFNSTLQPEKNKHMVVIIIGSAIGVVLVVVLCSITLLICIKNRRKENDLEEEHMEWDEDIDHEFESQRGPKRFSFRELSLATESFSEEKKLGEGGFGSVYKGWLSVLNLDVAIKRISKGSKQGRKEYISEVKIISRLRHRNLVQLIGWCHIKTEFLLVYEFMPNGSLDYYLYSTAKFLQWPARHRIAMGLASALFYLNEEWEQCVVHRDIKPSNVMLDSAFNAKLGDFGLARLVDHDGDLQTTDLAGTRGYMAPECFYTGKVSKQSDIYSFGIVALEIACGRRTIEPMEPQSKMRLVDWVWGLYGKGKILEAVDARMDGDFETRQIESLMVVGLWCAHPDSSLRPSIKQVIGALSFEAPLPVLPPKNPVPRYFAPEVEAYATGKISSVANSPPSGDFNHSFEFSCR
ncbi:L-type lectin-domain containing receptor kinase IX.1-like [Zingiber officinale]|nr:L-type lectin-domain containing receptor kinase IX.1-like [Zingiber officinale]